MPATYLQPWATSFNNCVLVLLIQAGIASMSNINRHRNLLLASPSAHNSMLLPSGHGQNRAGYLLSVIWSQFAISFCFIALHFYCRIRLMRNLWWDDWSCLFAFVGHHPPLNLSIHPPTPLLHRFLFEFQQTFFPCGYPT